jgi:subtilisin family serine protease
MAARRSKDSQGPVQPTQRFGRGDRPVYVPGHLVVRFRRDVVRRLAPVGPHTAAATLRRLATALPEEVVKPVEYLTRNLGLRSMRPLFVPARAPVRAPRGLGDLGTRYRALASSGHEALRETLAGYHLLDVGERGVKAAIRALSASRAVALVEPVPNRWLCATPSDPLLNLQWGLRAIRWFNAKLPSAAGVRVSVFDSGVDEKHPDLEGVVRAYRRDGSSARDHAGHGTHVVGIIAALVNNKIGIAGVANPQISMWKVFDDRDRFDDALWFEGLGECLVDGTQVINLSLGGEGKSQAEVDVFRELMRSGVVVCAAMGNEYEEGNPVEYPAAFAGVVSVGATDETGRRAPFSNTGRHIDVVAPGVNVLSTLPTKPTWDGEKEYASWAGTSMATPYVAGLAALLRAKHPTWTGKHVADRLRKTARKLAAMKKKSFTREYGHGLVDVAKALA